MKRKWATHTQSNLKLDVKEYAIKQKVKCRVAFPLVLTMNLHGHKVKDKEEEDDDDNSQRKLKKKSFPVLLLVLKPPGSHIRSDTHICIRLLSFRRTIHTDRNT